MKRLLMLFLALMLCIPAASAEDSVYFIDGRTADRVHLRVEATVESDSLGLYFSGTNATVLQWMDDWAWVMIGEVSGYMKSDFLTREFIALAGPSYMVDNQSSTWVNLRSSPSMTGAIALCPDNGTVVRVLGETADGWSYVNCQGEKGYMRTELLSPMEGVATLQRTTILAQQDINSYIHQYIAPNGKPIYFTALHGEPYITITFEDVNFDGWKDIVVLTISGASNGFYEFFVYDPALDEYLRVFHPGTDEGLCNYVLYPEEGIVGSHANNGLAGAEHEEHLYRWEGYTLKLIRSAISENLTVTDFSPGVLTTTTYTDMLHITVRDHMNGEHTILWEQTFSTEDPDLTQIFAKEEEALWQGIK